MSKSRYFICCFIWHPKFAEIEPTAEKSKCSPGFGFGVDRLIKIDGFGVDGLIEIDGFSVDRLVQIVRFGVDRLRDRWVPIF